MKKIEIRTRQNPKLKLYVLKNGRASLYLEYYLGRTQSPLLDEHGCQIRYSEGKMAGKPRYKVRHIRKKEKLNLYIILNPRSSQERANNRETISLAEKIRFEREQKFLEDREGYCFRKDRNVNFLDFCRNRIEGSAHSASYNAGLSNSLTRFVNFLKSSARYQLFAEFIRPDQITGSMMTDFSEYLRANGKGSGPHSIFMRFKRLVGFAVKEFKIPGNPCDGVAIKTDKRAIKKDILTPEEIRRLMKTHYLHENTAIQRAFILTLYCGIRFCDIKKMTFNNIDFNGKFLHFEQSKTSGKSSGSFVIIPLNNSIFRIIGNPPDASNPDTPVFNLPSYHACLSSLKTWVARAGINKNISWHCGRHSFAVNLLRAGANIKTVQTLMGHADITMTSRYLHIIDQDKTEAINSLGPIDYAE